MITTSEAGLAGVVAGQTALSTVGKKGFGLTYRGYSIEDLSEHATFEEVAWLLLHGELPMYEQLVSFSEDLRVRRSLPDHLKQILEILPRTSHPMDVLRTGCSVMGCLEPEESAEQEYEIAMRLLSSFPSMLCYWHHYHQSGQRIEVETDDDSIAGHFLHLLHGTPAAEHLCRALDVSLILYAEHEYNASTFAARITASTMSDLYSAITTGIGTLRGPLHGGANEASMELIESYVNADAAEQGVMDRLAAKQKIMGFGHRVYKTVDPRSDVIKRWSHTLCEETALVPLYEISERIEAVMRREKGLFPNLDFYAATVFHCLGIPTTMFTPLFVFARTAGWSAHVFEQRGNNRLIRPAAEYNGPGPRVFVPINERA